MENIHNNNILCSYIKFNPKRQINITCELLVCKNENNLKFCSVHLPLGEIGPNGKVIQCSICKQSIGEKIISKHSKKCINNNSEMNSFNNKDNKEMVNNEIITPRIWNKQGTKLNEIDELTLSNIAEKIDFIWQKLNLEIFESEVVDHNFLNNFFSPSQIKGKNGKHILQEASIIGNMKSEGILSNNSLFIEFGCGAGSLSQSIQYACDYKSSHILVDRMKYKSIKKCDKQISCNDQNFCKRIVSDIENLDLFKILKENNTNYNNIVACSKHLCGFACDLTINKIIEFVKMIQNNNQLYDLNKIVNNENKIDNNIVVGVAIATCCHYLLCGKSISNETFLSSFNITKKELEWITKITSWYTLKQDNGLYHNDINLDRKNLGYRAKILIDYARLNALINVGFKGRIVKYTSETKENSLILAKLLI